MNDPSIFYAFAQIIHNFGAVAVVGASAISLWTFTEPQTLRRLGPLVLSGWIVQILSGMGFGAVSYIFYQKLPDVHGIAKFALYLKLLCSVLGFFLTALYLTRGSLFGKSANKRLWMGIFCSAVVALSAAAILRWFS